MKNYKQTEILQEQNRDLKRQLNKVISGQIDIFCKWNLTKPTLEEQTEEVQREIHKLVKV